MKKRIPSLLLALTMVFSLAACGGAETPAPSQSAAPAQTAQPTPEPAPEPFDAELRRACELGLLPEEWQGQMDQTITFAEYARLCTALVEKWDESRLTEWNEKIKLAATSDDPMRTEDGYLMLSYLWVMMGYSRDHIFSYRIDDGDQGGWTREESMDELSWNYPCFPDWETEVYDVFHSNYMWGALCSFPDVMSRVSGEYMFCYDEAAGSYHMQDPLSRDTAVRALLRMAEYGDGTALEPDGDYVACADAGTYDPSIITAELLGRTTDLPEPTQARLPAEWKGAGISVYKGKAESYLHFRKADLQFMAGNGFNFIRLFFDFQTLRFPNYPADPYLINMNELRELDQMLAWCMENGVHLQISMSGYMDAEGNTRQGWVPDDDESWALNEAYWAMLAERYAGIPSRYLSFELSNEEEPETEAHMNRAIVHVSGLAKEIWEADPDRVVLYAQEGNGKLAWTELLAQNGIAIGCHPYKPGFIACAGWEYIEQNPYAEPCWPQPYFPMGNVMQGRADVTIRGDVAGAKLSVHIWNSGEAPSIEIQSNGRLVETFRPVGRSGDDGQYYYGSDICSTQLPDDTSEITLRVVDDWARIDTIIVEGSAGRTVMVPSDHGDYPDFTDPLPLIVNPDGSYTNSENRVFDADFIYDRAVKPYRDIAEKYGVGFMCDEFGMFGTRVNWDIDTVSAYHETCLEMMEKYQIGWCYCELANTFPKHLLIQYGDQSQWKGATVEEVEYDGTTLRFCSELLDVFRRRTMG